MRTTRIYGLLILLLSLLIACGGGGSGGGVSSTEAVISEVFISTHNNSAELQWQNPSTAENQGIYQFTITYEVVPNINQQTKRIHEPHIYQALRSLNVVETEINDIASETLTSISQSRIWDWDQDKIGADTDNCLHIANPSQQDADRDGIGDACDTTNAALRFIPDDRQVTISWPNPVSNMIIDSFTLTISPAGRGRTQDIVINKDDPGFSDSDDSLSWYVYNQSGLRNDIIYDVRLSVTYENSTSVPLTAKDSPTKHPYQASVRLGPNHDGDELADSVDPDQDNDGIVNDRDSDPLFSALEGTHLLAYEGDTDNLARYFNANQPVSYNLNGLAPDSHYAISVTAHIRTYVSNEFAALLGHNINGIFIPDSVDTSKQERTSTVLDGNNILVFVATDAYTDPDPFIPIILSHVGIDRLIPFVPINSDLDKDGVIGRIDLDRDGDGLIELKTQGELNAIRYVLDGTGFRSSNTSEIDQAGCQNCHGYEILNDIALTDYDSGEGWLPLGGDEDTNISNGCQGSGFSGMFDGNGHTISKLSINRPQALCVGLFGEVEDGAIIRSLRVQADRINGLHGVGILIGVDRGSSIIDASASMTANQAINGHNFTGGLVGEAYDTRIDDSAVTFGNMNGEVYVGGLVGRGINIMVHDSTVDFNNINGARLVGGLVGRGTNIMVHDSTVNFNNINGARLVGGLVGYNRDGSIMDVTVSGQDINNMGQYTGGLAGGLWKTTITNADVTVNDIMGKNDTGGLMGYGVSSNVTNSHIKAKDIMGNDWVGGLIAGGAHSRVVGSSSEFDLLSGNDWVGGLIGMGTSSNVRSSMVLGKTIEGNQLIGGLIGSGDDANVSSSSSSFIDLMGRSALGGLIGSGDSLTIYNSTASSHSILGTGLHSNDIGGLVGHGEKSSIKSSHANTTHLQGNNFIGGLIGYGIESSVIFSSAIVDGPILGNSTVGGLIGSGRRTLVRSSYAMTNSIEATNYYVGGLIGNGQFTTTIASFAITGLIKGNDLIGGIVGDGWGSQIISSYAIINSSDTNRKVGGLIGDSSIAGEARLPIIKHTYVVGGDSSFTDLVLSGRVDATDAVYYDRSTKGEDTSNNHAKTTAELQTPTNFTGTIYEDWSMTITRNYTVTLSARGNLGNSTQYTLSERSDLPADIIRNASFLIHPHSQSHYTNNKFRIYYGVHSELFDAKLTSLCDDNLNGIVDSDETTFVWDLGSSDEYPAINCTPLSAADQRKAYSVEEGEIPLNFSDLE